MKTTECVNDENSWIHGVGGWMKQDNCPVIVGGGSSDIYEGVMGNGFSGG